ncbi:Oligosaccharide translocation protein rft1 [Pleurotus pulmonarius]|nr:Oligosaccharide translocation protein rft1 [Pleurotus pulmonarius]
MSSPDHVDDASPVPPPKARSSLTSLFILHVLTRFLTFALNQLLLRTTTPTAFGVTAIQFELVFGGVVLLLREGVRGVVVRLGVGLMADGSNTTKGTLQRSREIQSLTNLTHLPLLAGAPILIVVSVLYASFLASSETASQPHFVEAVVLYSFAGLLELGCEPAYGLATSTLRTDIRVRAEGLGVTLKSVATFLILYFSHHSHIAGDARQYALLAYAFGQLAYSITLALSYATAFKDRSSLLSLMPTYFIPRMVNLAFTINAQALLKHVLTESDKLVLSSFSVSLAAQGGYAIAANYGSLVARLVFLPIEESLRLFFSRILALPSPASPSQSPSTEPSSPSRSMSSLLHAHGSLATLLKSQLSLSLILVTFAPIYLPYVLPLLLPPAFLQETNAAELLQAWLWCLPVLSLNGGLESFVAVTAETGDIARQSLFMFLFSLLYVLSSLVFYSYFRLGDAALIYANIVNLLARIAFCLSFVRAFFRDQYRGRVSAGAADAAGPKAGEVNPFAFKSGEWLPDPRVVAACVLSYAVLSSPALVPPPPATTSSPMRYLLSKAVLGYVGIGGVLGLGLEPLFFTQIKVEGDDSVDWLLRELHSQLVAQRYDVERMDLALYKTDMEMQPTEGRTARILQWLRTQSEADELDLTQPLRVFFAGGMSHKIVVANTEVKEVLDHIDDPGVWSRIRIRKDLGRRISKLSDNPSPPSIVGSAADLKKFLDADGHPVCIDHVPATMFSPLLAALQRKLSDLEHVDVTLQDITYASSFLSATVQFYDDEAQRQTAIKPQVNNLMGMAGIWVTKLEWLGNIEPDAIWWQGQGKFATGILELNNVHGVGGDPFVQSLADYSKIVASSRLAPFQGSCNFPVLIIGLSGNRLEIGAAVCVGSIYASRFVSFDITAGVHLSDNIVRVARTFKCLSLCRTALEEYYIGITGDRTTTAAIYPNPTSASGDAMPSLTYHGFLSPGGDEFSDALQSLDWAMRTTLLYRATLESDGDKTEVVVKFTSRYNEAAHRLLSDAQLAPKLHWCGQIVGGLSMVVMEYLEDGVSLWRICKDPLKRERVPGMVLENVKDALDLLHSKGLVFGDVRDANVVWSKDRGFLVDFDWAGKEGEDLYPASINASKSLKRHPEVCAYGVMRTVHDDFQLELLKRLLK